MIGRILDALAPRVTAADVVVKVDGTLTVAISADGDTRVGSVRSQTSHLRIIRDGRVGYASATEDDAGELAGRAMAAAASGGEIELFLPAPSPLPEVMARAPQAAAADVAVLEGLARTLLERLRRSSRRVEVWAERSSGSVRVGNTRGVLAGYDVTLGGVGATVESIEAGGAPPCRVHSAATGLPTLQEIETLVTEVDARLDRRIIEGSGTVSGSMPVCLAPRAVAIMLRPLRAALAGFEALLGNSPYRGKVGEPVTDERFSLTDDPLVPGRPGSRPIDDDGVISRRLPLIERGRLIALLADLEVGARADVPSTGHAWRLPFSAPRVGFTNLRVLPGIESRATLLTMMGKGLLVEDLEWGSGPNPLTGAIALRAPWTYLVEGGAVRGRLEGIVLSGNVFELLKRIGAVGNDAAWIGAMCLPSLLLEGVEVARG